MKLSIIVPVFNEEKTIAQVIKKLLEVKINNLEKEIIVIDDGSTDNSKFKIQNSKLDGIKIYSHSRNLGKGAAVKTGIRNATGDYVLIQDADLEYNPNDIKKLIFPIQENKTEVVYGTRLKRLPNFYKDEKTPRFILHYLGNKFLSFLTSLLYGQWITDMETCYKIFPRNTAIRFNLKSKGFDFEPEITSKLLKSGYRILEIPISTNPRGYNEGKKLNTFKDGFIALWTLLKWKFKD